MVSLAALHCALVPLLRKTRRPQWSSASYVVLFEQTRGVRSGAVRCVVSSSGMTVGAIYPMEYSMHCAEPAACNMPCCKPKPASATARISLSVSRCTEGPLPSAAAAEWIDDVGTVFAPAESDRWAMVCSTPSRAERSHQKEPKTRAWRTQKEWPQRTVCRRALRSVPLQRCNAATLRHATVQAQRTDSELWRLQMPMRRVCH